MARKKEVAEKPKEKAFDGAKGARGLVALSKRFDEAGWRPAREQLMEVRAVPTLFPGVDAVLGVGGWPTDRFGLIHGASAEGKTTFVLGLMLSFLLRGHSAAFIDAENTTPAKWVRELFPAKQFNSPLFLKKFPESYEQTVDAVRSWATAIGDAREHGEIDEQTSGICVVDSIRKLVPKRLLETLMAQGSEDKGDKGDRWSKKAKGVDGLGGRAAQYKAALNAAWMDELTILLGQTGTCMVAIGREHANSDQRPGGFDDEWTLGGGRSLFFDSSVVARVGLDRQLIEGEGESKRTLGERHYVQVRKTKIERKEAKYPRAFFHVSNGLDTPFGFDKSRDLIEVGVDCGIVEQSGSWFAFDGLKLGQGAGKAATFLASNDEVRERLEAAVRKTFLGVHDAAEESDELPPDTKRCPVSKATKGEEK